MVKVICGRPTRSAQTATISEHHLKCVCMKGIEMRARRRLEIVIAPLDRSDERRRRRVVVVENVSEKGGGKE